MAFKSKHFPDECVTTRRGSPLLVGIKTKTRLATDHIPILYGKGKKYSCARFGDPKKKSSMVYISRKMTQKKLNFRLTFPNFDLMSKR